MGANKVPKSLEQLTLVWGSLKGGCASMHKYALTLEAFPVLQELAEKYQFIIVTPDSQSASLSGWRVPLAKQAATPDVLHAQVSASNASRGTRGQGVDMLHPSLFGSLRGLCVCA